MFAVIRTGGKQYRVAPDDILEIEKTPGAIGETIAFSDVLLVGREGEIAIGAPLVDGAAVAAEVLEQKRGEKIIVFKKKRRANYRRKKGHRQELTTVRILAITTGEDLTAGKPVETTPDLQPEAAPAEAAAPEVAGETAANAE